MAHATRESVHTWTGGDTGERHGQRIKGLQEKGNGEQVKISEQGGMWSDMHSENHPLLSRLFSTTTITHMSVSMCVSPHVHTCTDIYIHTWVRRGTISLITVDYVTHTFLPSDTQQHFMGIPPTHLTWYSL